ncbi:MAG: type I asparaginase [Rikenellaceae bacterium]
MKRILLIYTGGTIGMKENPLSGALSPVDFSEIEREVPELHKFNVALDTITFSPVIDSSNVTVDCWVTLATIIEENYTNYDGFVVLHGTDTMSYTASALSFMLSDLAKPVVFTGSQLPIGVLRTDGRENLISAIEVAAAGVVKEVTIFFQNLLMRANRTTKYNSSYFNAFRSDNFPPLAEAGITIDYNMPLLHRCSPGGVFSVAKKLSRDVAVLKIFPGITPEIVGAILGIENLRGVVMESYGAGNALTEEWFVGLLRGAIERGIIIVNVTQCAAGSVDMSLYETGRELQNIGVLSGSDMTFEAAMTKLMYLLGMKNSDTEKIKIEISRSIRGEKSS